MDIARNRLFFLIIFGFQVFQSILIYGDWNEDFLNVSWLLIENINCFQNQINHYKETVDRFISVQSRMKKNLSLMDVLRQLSTEDKKIFRFDEFIIKKRAGNGNLNDVFWWEISIILGLSEYVIPSFPFEFRPGCIITIQPFEDIVIGPSWIVPPHSSITSQVSMQDYWLAHIVAFLLGADDLSGLNLGISLTKKIRFFDNEGIFLGDLTPVKTSLSFSVPFASISFDWVQYRRKVGLELSLFLRRLILNLKNKETELNKYFDLRNIPEATALSITKRIEILSGFKITPTSSFLDFIRYIYPSIANGLDELNSITGNIIQRNVDHGTSLFFCTRFIRFWCVSDENKKRLNAWINKYII